MLVPVDSHDLLKRMAADGWSKLKWRGLVCPRPRGQLGDEWAMDNMALVEGSEGLLAPYNCDLISHFTARGSHGTAAIRLMKFGARGIHPEISEDGMISRSQNYRKRAVHGANPRQGLSI